MSNFLLVDLNETKTKKLAETITSNTSRKILNHLTQKDHDTENNISKELSIPISTVHYHLQKLVEAKLLDIKEFHYSEKGREINHYKLANKYIIIAPKKVSGLREKLKGILPVTLATLTISAIIKFIQSSSLKSFQTLSAGMESAPKIAMDSAVEESAMLAARTPEVAQRVISQPDIALWFLIGSLATIIIYILIDLIKEKIAK
jgi:predicted ArsR family transcriptional regulator